MNGDGVERERERERENKKKKKRLFFFFVDRPCPPLFLPFSILSFKNHSRGKAALLEGDIPNLERLARKGLRRAPPGTSAERAQKVAAVKEAVAALADGLHAPAKRYFPSSGAAAGGAAGGPSSSSSNSASSSTTNPSSFSTIQALKAKGKTVIMLDETKWGSRADADGYYSQSEAAAGFRKVMKEFFFFTFFSSFFSYYFDFFFFSRSPFINFDCITTLAKRKQQQQEFEDAAARQDRGALADIERGLGELSQIAGAVGDALADQAVLAVAVEDKVAEASRGVKKSNVRMKSLLGQVRG